MSCSVPSSLGVLYSDRYICPLMTRNDIGYEKDTCPLVIKTYCINDFALVSRKDLLFNCIFSLVSTKYVYLYW